MTSVSRCELHTLMPAYTHVCAIISTYSSGREKKCFRGEKITLIHWFAICTAVPTTRSVEDFQPLPLPSLPPLQNFSECPPSAFPKLVCTLNHTGDAFTVSQTVQGQDYCFVVMSDPFTPGGHRRVIKAVKYTPSSPLPTSLSAAYLTFRCPIQFCSDK